MVRFGFLFFFFFALVSGLQSAVPSKNAFVYPRLNLANPEGIIIDIHIVFGRQRPEGECRGFGICDFVLIIKGGISAQNDRSGFASASQTANKKLKLVFDRNTGMSRTAHDSFFSKEHFLIEVETVVPAAVCRKLGLPDGYRIRPGNYPIERSGSTLTLVL
jgi:hypothetical protein